MYVLAIENEAVIFSLVLEGLSYSISMTGVSRHLVYSCFLSRLVEDFFPDYRFIFAVSSVVLVIALKMQTVLKNQRYQSSF